MKGKFIVVLGICLTFTFHSRSNEQGIGYLLEQLSFQMGQRNLFQAEKTLAKLSKVAPNQPVYLQENIRFLIEADRLAEARVQLLKVKRKIPDSDHQALMLLLDIYQNKRKVLSEARLLNKRQLYSQALDKYQSLFAGQPLHYSLALEYWDILTEVKPELEPTVLYKLKRLAKQFPANTRIKLAYYKYSLRAGVNRRDIYDELYLLTFNTVWKFEAKRLWQYGLLNSEVTAANGPLYLAYMQRFPDDNWVSLHYKEGNDAMDKHRTLM